MGKDYSAQEKHIRKHYARFPLDLRPEVLEEFKKVCKENGTTPTTEIKKFIASYCEAARAKQRGGRQDMPPFFFRRKEEQKCTST